MYWYVSLYIIYNVSFDQFTTNQIIYKVICAIVWKYKITNNPLDEQLFWFVFLMEKNMTVWNMLLFKKNINLINYFPISKID